jgi:hypothetical protein
VAARHAIIAAIALVGGCRGKDEQREQLRASGFELAPALPQSKPQREARAARLDPPPLAEDAAALLPPVAGTLIAPAKLTRDGRQLHATWCVAGTSAEQAARQLAATLTAASWSDLQTRGDAHKAGVAGDRDGYQLSLVVSASAVATCAAPAHYFVTATMFRLASR